MESQKNGVTSQMQVNPTMGKIGSFLVRQLFKLRYKVTIRGLDRLEGNQGYLFLPNHPCHFDPIIMTSHLWDRFTPRPMAIDYCFWTPVMSKILRYIKGFPVPNFHEGFSQIKLRRMERILEEVGTALENGANIVIYPAGNLMRSNKEMIGGASGVHTLIQRHRNIKVVLVRIRGLWGSIGGTAYSAGISPKPIPLMKRCAKILLKNLIFFAPRRKVDIEFVPAPENFPWDAEKMDFNRWLDNWYHAPGYEELNRVSLCRWWPEYPEPVEKVQEKVDLSQVSEEIKLAVIEQLSLMTNTKAVEINPGQHLSNELGLDSLDISNLMIWMEERFQVQDISLPELVSVGSVMEVCASRGGKKEAVQDAPKVAQGWDEHRSKPRPDGPIGNTIQEAFLERCEKMDGWICMGDDNSGIMSWKQLKVGAFALARAIREMPGDRIGIMLPASVGATVTTFAVLLADKTPVMINWTLGPRNLEHIRGLTGIEVVLTSQKFIDKIGAAELGDLEEILVFLEEVKALIGLEDKIRSLVDSFKSTSTLLREWELENIDPDEESVILFTSGSEAVPKGVPLTHRNIISNLKDVFDFFHFYPEDVVLSFLPPFHSFGYVITTIMPMLCGVKIAYYPNPTETRKLAQSIPRWKTTLIYGTPTFLAGILNACSVEQLRTVRGMGGGAEKFPDELFQKAREMLGKAYVVEGYGITECSPILTMNEPFSDRDGVGRPFPSVEIKIVHQETYESIPQTETGMILAHGPNIFPGYLGEVGREAFIHLDGKRWYITGDLGCFTPGGAIELKGRKKRFVKVAGEMVSLPALETALTAKWPAGEDGPIVAVEAMEIDGERPRICGFSSIDLSLDDMNAVLKSEGFGNVARLNEYKRIEKIPLLGTGKTDYRALKGTLLPDT